MSCQSCYPNDCLCGTATETSCSDPGLETTGRHLAIYDSQFCERRLANTTGFLTYGTNGFNFTADPKVPLTQLVVDDGDLFTGLVINTSTGYFRSIVPANGVTGFIRGNGAGQMSFVPDSDVTATIPDPLVVTNLVATNASIANLAISGVPGFTGLNTETIVYPLGLNGANQLVKGSTATSSVALFYESPSMGSPARPNFTYPGSANAAVQIGNEIYDADGIAHVTSSEVISIDVAGVYDIEWFGQYIGYNINGDISTGTAFNPGLWLTVNGVLRSQGNIQTYQDRNVGGTAMGLYATPLSVGDQIRLIGNGSMRSNAANGSGTGLCGVTVKLTKLKS